MSVNPNIGFFDLVDETADAMACGDVIYDVAPDAHTADKKVFIVFSKGLPDEDLRIKPIGDFITDALEKQLTAEEFADTENFVYGVTRYKGCGCFYFRWPQNRSIDAEKLKAAMASVRDMFKEANPLSVPPGYDPAHHIAVGPFKPEQIQDFAGYMARVAGFNSYAGMYMRPFENKQGGYLVYERAAYLGLFRNEKSFQPSPEDRQRYGYDANMN